MPLSAQQNVWVTIQYRLFDSTNEALEEDDREMTYLHGGYGEVFDKLEHALQGAEVGANLSVYLEPDDSFGDYDAELVRMAKRQQFPDELEEGMMFEGVPGEASDGVMYTVTDIADGMVILDGNHPLAGMAIRFELTVVDLVPATPEEVDQELQRSGQEQRRMLH